MSRSSTRQHPTNSKHQPSNRGDHRWDESNNPAKKKSNKHRQRSSDETIDPRMLSQIVGLDRM